MMQQGWAEARIKQSKDWRKRLDDVLQEMKDQQREERADTNPVHEAGRNHALSVTHLEDAIMRQGMRMKAINEAQPGVAANPYPTSYDASTAKVEPTADNLKL